MKSLKFFGFTLSITCFFLTTLIVFPFFFFFPVGTRSILVRIVSFYSRVMLAILNIKVQFHGLEHIQKNANYLIVSNHLSYLDVLMVSGRVPACFVTSREVKESAFLGQIVSLAGCLFVDRKKRTQIKEEIRELSEALSAGLNVAIFPEATSTNGDGVLNFKRPLFEAALVSGKPVLPLTINYLSISGEKTGTKNRDVVCWYGDMNFFPHFLKLLDQTEVLAEIVVAPPLVPEALQSLELAQKSHAAIIKIFRPLNHEVQEAL